jgi:hypothetical protein
MAPVANRDVWLNLTRRHLRMARRLGEAALYDGAVFHTYHAFECFVSAALASRGHDPAKPPTGYRTGSAGRVSSHVAILNWFQDEYRGQAVASDSSALRVYLCGLTGRATTAEHDLRNSCLYYTAGAKPPWIVFKSAQYLTAYKRVRDLCRQYASSV